MIIIDALLIITILLTLLLLISNLNNKFQWKTVIARNIKEDITIKYLDLLLNISNSGNFIDEN